MQNEALQKEQFANNMWRRAMTTSPQLSFYWLGDQVLQRLEASWLEAHPELEGIAGRSAFANALMDAGPLQLADLASALDLPLDQPSDVSQGSEAPQDRPENTEAAAQ